MPVIRVQAKGQMTVPRAIREAVGITTGTELWCARTEDGAFECRVLPAPVALGDYLESHSFAGRGPSEERMEREIEEGIAASNVDHRE